MKMWNISVIHVLTVTVLMQIVSGQELRFVPTKINEDKASPSEPLTLQWGIADTTAYVGKVFTFTLPSDAFQGNVVGYDITEAGKDKLPDWLIFNTLKAELKGIPGPQNKGQVYLKVIATGDDNSEADDVFSIEILDDTFGTVGVIKQGDDNAPKHVLCKREEPQTIVTVIVDCDLDLMKATDKMKLVDNLVGHLNLAPEMVKLMPVGEKPMFDSNSLVAGPGNTDLPKYVGGLISWTVGCGQVDDGHMPVIQLAETSAKDGAMSAALGHYIIGWHVTNTMFQRKHRKRRQAATATPTMTLAPPTKVTDVMESSEVIKPTSTVTMMATSTDVDKTTKEVDKSPDMISPSTIKMDETKTIEATAILPTKTFKMTTDTMTKAEIMPSSTVVTTSSVTTSTPKPTTEKATKPITKRPPPSTTTTEKPKVVTPEPMCPETETKAPYIRSPLKNFTLTAGVIKKLKIPENTFFDCLDGKTSDLNVIITKPNGDSMQPGFWLQLNKRTFRPYQIIVNPLDKDVGSYDFVINATNFLGKSNSHKFNMVVLEGKKMSSLPNHEMSMTIDTNYEKFMSSLDNRLELSNKIANVFGDRNSNSMTVTRLEKGSVIYAFTNNTLAGDDCNVEAIGKVFDKVVTEDGQITPEAKMKLKPYKLTSVVTAPLGSCENNPNFPVRAASVIQPTMPQKPTTKMMKSTTDKPTEKSTVKDTEDEKEDTEDGTKDTEDETDDTKDTETDTTKKKAESTTANVAAAGAGSGGGGSDIWITTVVPAIVVVIVLIIALIIACCLYRKKRKGKMKLKEKNSFGTGKGVPVIFADELDEKPNDSTRPLIMDEERPPMPPPEYQRASSETSGNSNSTQPIGDKDIEEIEMEDTDITSPLYSPPPPVTASNNSKPPHVQSSRGPPPYVPP